MSETQASLGGAFRLLVGGMLFGLVASTVGCDRVRPPPKRFEVTTCAAHSESTSGWTVAENDDNLICPEHHRLGSSVRSIASMYRDRWRIVAVVPTGKKHGQNRTELVFEREVPEP